MSTKQKGKQVVLYKDTQNTFINIMGQKDIVSKPYRG